MSNELLIEAGPHETRVAILEDGQVVEVHIERALEPGVVGNIYKGRVSRVVPAIQAAFVDIGLQRDAFLFAGDLQRSGPFELSTDEGQERQPPDHRPIADQVKEGQDLLVQAVKEPLPGKGARISSQLSLPGKLTVLLPRASGAGISRQISSPEERQRLEGLLEEMMPAGHGVIVRTAGAERQGKELRRDLEGLLRSWQEIQKRSTGITAPGLVHQELGLAKRAARDLLNEGFSDAWIEGAAAHAAIERYLEELDREMVGRLRLYKSIDPLFEHRGVDSAIAKAMRSRVWLNSGGFIVINPTEALVAIDVNSGRNTEAAALEATAFATNLEAAVEAAHQIRLRDLAGIIVVDFIDMIEPEHRAELVTCFETALGRDRTRTQISQMSDFGLIAVTRKRMRGGLRQRLTRICPCCSGEGRVMDPTTVGFEMGRAVRRRARESTHQDLRVRLHSRTKTDLEERQQDLLSGLRESVAGQLDLEADDDLGIDEFEIDTR
jgi:ribonuclease G